jgi:putative nucleotidyltransferase with HDIG domain
MEHNIEEFKIYTDNYLYLGDPILLKVDHTFRVVDLCEEIAKSLNLSDEDIELAKICGLLHDIARFEQYKQYQTYRDRISVDHGDLGYEILTENNYLDNYLYNKEDENVILNAVRFHNKKDIPEELSDREKLFLKITKDADKIDILYLITIGHIVYNIQDTYFSDGILDSIRNNTITDSNLVKTKADVVSISLGYIFDVNFPISIKILHEKDYINKEIDMYKNMSTNKKTKKQFEEIREIISKYMEKRMKDVR